MAEYTAPCKIFELPIELRNVIYELLLGHGTVYHCKTRRWRGYFLTRHEEPARSLLSTCKQIHEELAPMSRHNKHLVFASSDYPPSMRSIMGLEQRLLKVEQRLLKVAQDPFITQTRFKTLTVEMPHDGDINDTVHWLTHLSKLISKCCPIKRSLFIDCRKLVSKNEDREYYHPSKAPCIWTKRISEAMGVLVKNAQESGFLVQVLHGDVTFRGVPVAEVLREQGWEDVENDVEPPSRYPPGSF